MTYVNGSSVIAISVIFPFLGTLSVALRFAVRHRKKNGLGIDDWLILLGLILMTASGITMIVGSAKHTFGYHSPPTSASNFSNEISQQQIILEKCEWVLEVMQPLALGFTKLSILYFYRRIFRGKIFDLASWALIAITTTWLIAFELATIFDCKLHFSADWGSIAELKADCDDSFKEQVALSISDVIIDIFILILPIPLVWKLQMSIRRKIVISAILLTGAFAIAAGMVRMVIFCKLLVPSLLSSSHVLGVSTADDIGVISLLFFWAMVQMGVAVTVACLPTLRPIFHGFSPESVIRSIRSRVSLHSLRSKGSNHSYNDGSPKKSRSGSDSFIPLAEDKLYVGEDAGIQTFIMGEVDQSREDGLPEGGIRVMNKISRSFEQV